MKYRLTSVLLAFATCGITALPMVANAQNYPNTSISVIVPFPAGGPSDVVARIVTEHMGRTLGQQMVIENVAGAGGTLGSARVATAQPDGYTLLAGSMGSHVAAPVLTPNIKYDSERDFEPIGLTAHSPAVIVARKDFPANNLTDDAGRVSMIGRTAFCTATKAFTRPFEIQLPILSQLFSMMARTSWLVIVFSL